MRLMSSLSVILITVTLVFRVSAYSVNVVSIDPKPVLSFVDGTSKAYQQVFNPTYVEATTQTQMRSGLLSRSQNCSAEVGGPCVACSGTGQRASVLTFSLQISDGVFKPVTSDDVVFGPHDITDACGTEDPRMIYNPQDNLYYMFYTAYSGVVPFLSLATSPDPSSPNKWTRHGFVFPSLPGSKSAALVLSPDITSVPHHLIWGDSSIKIASSFDLKSWPSNGGTTLISPRSSSFDSGLVEAGPPPLLLSTGDYLFFYNSANSGWPSKPGSAYNVGWLILDGRNVSNILQRSSTPLLSPGNYPFLQGVAPYTCNEPNVVFLEAATPVPGKKDTFRVFFGGADTVVGTAIISV